MIAVDTNVLIQAHREELPRHLEAVARLHQLAEGELPWGIPVFCLAEFIRVVTHPKVFDPPSTLDQALSAVEGLLDSPTLRVLNPGPRYAGILLHTVRDAEARANLVFDAQIAAVCLEHGAIDLLTLDRDFQLFAGVRVSEL